MAPPSFAHLSTRIALITKLKNDPNWVDGNPDQPGRPQLSKALTNYILAGLLRDIAARISRPATAAKLHSIGTGLVSSAASGLVAGWEDGDLCPPWPWPWPRRDDRGPSPDPWLERLTLFDPQPEPWAESWLEQAIPALQDAALGQMALQVGSLVSDGEFAGEIKEVVAELGG